MSNYTCFARSLIFTIISFGILMHEFVEGKTTSNTATSIIKTIKGDNREIIDCYDIYSQPAFNNPLLRNHKIQMEPSSYPKGVQPKDQGIFKLTQSWHKYGLCPEGTVPVRRSRKNYNPRASISSTRQLFPSLMDATTTVEYAIITPDGDTFQGAQASINIWKPLIEQPEEYSTSQIWISTGHMQEVIITGWEVNKKLYDDNEPRFTLHWTADKFNTTGCYNIYCPGFVQTTSKISLGSNFDHISIINGTQYSSTFVMFQEKSTGNWWLQLEGIVVGYWPHLLFKQLSVKATRTDFGGFVLNTKPNGRHTNTQMGSGHFPSEGAFGISSFFDRVKVVDGNYESKIPKYVTKSITNPNCYDLILDKDDSSGIKFNYGGPGFSSTCQ
ncbi:uncharacterized protein LOC113334212 [Papaver somniferum]|uniref:uncharacterized protein LOC113334212 n=1 Tax=Papaver somniferum TaxID=3469 RepID=UPI000E700DC1|nr:uncharacterized protein LOC113334212 [Papaver somniferum]